MAQSDFFKDFSDWILQPFRKESKSVWRVFALCFLTAFIFWIFNSLNKSYTTVISFPLEVVYDQEKYIPVNDLPKSTRVEVSGFGWDLLRWSLGIGLEPMTLIPEDYDRNSVSMNEYRNLISEKLGQVKVSKFISDSLILDFDRKLEKKFALQIDTSTIRLRKNYRLKDSIIIVPDSITLTGPKSILENLKDNFMVRLPDKRIDEDFDEQVDLDFKSNPMVSLGRESVNVYFKVERLLEREREFEVRAVNFGSDSVEPVPSSVKVKFRIPERSKPIMDSMYVIASYFNMNAADSTAKVEILNIPEELEDLQIIPDSVMIKKF